MIVSEPAARITPIELERLLTDELGDLLHIENMLLKALPKLVAGSTDPELKELFQAHLVETAAQVKRIETMFAELDLPAREKKCEGMMGLLVECQHLLTRAKASAAVDQALICAARKIESFEIISYRSVAHWADLCGQEAIASRARESASEEEGMSEALAAKVASRRASTPARQGKTRAAVQVTC